MAIYDLLLTEEGDLNLDTICEPSQITGDEAVLQISRQHLKLWRGNWFRNTSYGTDWASVLKKNINQNFMGQIIAASLLQLDFVEEVVDVFLYIEKSTRAAMVTIVFIANGQEFKLTESL